MKFRRVQDGASLSLFLHTITIEDAKALTLAFNFTVVSVLTGQVPVIDKPDSIIAVSIVSHPDDEVLPSLLSLCL